MDNQFIEKYRRESYILDHNRNRSDLNPTVIEGNKTNLEGHLLQLKGNENGVYFDNRFKEQTPTLTMLHQKQTELEKRWEQHCLDQLKMGNPRPKHMPELMQEESGKLEPGLRLQTRKSAGWKRNCRRPRISKKSPAQPPDGSTALEQWDLEAWRSG